MSLDIITLGLAKSYADHHGGGGGSVPKPLTYDYMPEGYPTKTVQTTVLMGEQEIAFSDKGRMYVAVLTDALNLVVGQTYIVNWDGTEYECVCFEFNSSLLVGNLSIMGAGADTGEPFVYSSFDKAFVTLDTAPSHTISVIGPKIEYKEIDKNFLPALPYMNKTNPAGDGSFSLNRKANTDVGDCSFAEGCETTASGGSSHAEGCETTASGANSHAEGYGTTASGGSSHAEGCETTASGIYSHAEGLRTIAAAESQHVQGKFNIADNNNVYAHIVGNGTSDTKKSNAHTLDWNGVGWFKDSVKVGGVSQDDSAAKTLATTDYVDTTVSTKISGKQDTLIQSGAAVGQIAKITAVDDNGKPTAWQAVDMPSGGGGSAATTLHINVTAVNMETMKATFTADKTPAEMLQAAATGPVWCVVTFAAGIMDENAVSIGIPPAWIGGGVAFGSVTANVHNDNGNNKTGYVVRAGSGGWLVDLTQFGG